MEKYFVLCYIVPALQEKGEAKKPRQIRYVSYCEWALEIMKFQQEDAFKHYNYPEEMLNYIRTLVSNNIKGEI